MIEQLTTLAERKAQEAEKFVAFDGINLLGLKRKIETILGLIGRDGIFDEYTVHDISHIDVMLTSLEWLRNVQKLSCNICTLVMLGQYPTQKMAVIPDPDPGSHQGWLLSLGDPESSSG